MRDWPGEVQPRYRRAIFLDRDGTINADTHYPHQADKLTFIPGAIEGLRLLSALEYHLIVISNQAGIALGLFTYEQMSAFNAAMREQVENQGGRLDAFYYSPYLESKNLPNGSKTDFSTKPNPGMLVEAAEDFSLRLEESFVVGDKSSDVAAGQRAGCRTILVMTGKAGKEEDAVPCEPDFVAANLYEAARLILSLCD